CTASATRSRARARSCARWVSARRSSPAVSPSRPITARAIARSATSWPASALSSEPRRACVRVALLAIAAIVVGAASGRAANCDPWPGEPRPLPALNDPDPVRAEWASLRVTELAQWARRAETDDPLRARQMWRRLLCLDPANDEAVQGVLRAKTVRVHRP